MNKKGILLIILLLIVISAGSIYYYFVKRESEISTQPIVENKKTEIEPVCLSDDEETEKIRTRQLPDEMTKQPRPLYISIKDKNTKEEKFSFSIENVDYGRDWTTQIRKCGVYVLRAINFDYENQRGFSDFRLEVWRYRYDGTEEKIIEESSFSIDETETYIALIKGWYGEPEEHALVVKNLKTMEDEYVITLKELMEKYPDVEPATISLDWWGQKRFKTEDIFDFHLLNSERTGFNINVKTGELKIFRYQY